MIYDNERLYYKWSPLQLQERHKNSKLGRQPQKNDVILDNRQFLLSFFLSLYCKTIHAYKMVNDQNQENKMHKKWSQNKPQNSLFKVRNKAEIQAIKVY